MTEDDYKEIISAYQKKSFELFNSNIVLEVQINKLSEQVKTFSSELEKLKSKAKKANQDFE
jgi:prefoldin subunit 5